MTLSSTILPSTGSGSPLARGVSAQATASIATDATDDGSWDIGYLSSLLLKVESDAGGTLTLYASQDALDNDLRSLPPEEDPSPGIGVLADFTFPNGGDVIEVSPPVTIYSDENPATTFVFYRFTRSEAGTGVANIDLTILGLEE